MLSVGIIIETRILTIVSFCYTLIMLENIVVRLFNRYKIRPHIRYRYYGTYSIMIPNQLGDTFASCFKITRFQMSLRRKFTALSVYYAEV